MKLVNRDCAYCGKTLSFFEKSTKCPYCGAWFPIQNGSPLYKVLGYVFVLVALFVWIFKSC